MAVQKELERFETFMDKYSVKLEGVQQHLEDNVEHSYDASMKPVDFALEPLEECPIYELVTTDNKV